MFLSLTSMVSLTSLMLGNPMPFAIKYTVGNLLSISASGFLVGPGRLCGAMFAAERRVASLIYIGSLLTTLGCIFYLHQRLLTTLSLGVQTCAMVWYFATWVPFGRSLLQSAVGRCIDCLW